MARKPQTLEDFHAQADAQAVRALDTFRTVSDALNQASLSHQTVADSAQAEIDRHTALRDAAIAAADQRARQAEAISNLVG